MEKLLSYASQDGAESGVYVKVCAEHVMTTLEINDAGMTNRLFKTAETSYIGVYSRTKFSMGCMTNVDYAY